MMFRRKKLNIVFLTAILVSIFTPYFFSNTGLVLANPEEEKEMEAQIKELEEKIAKYRTGITVNQQKARSLETEMAILDD